MTDQKLLCAVGNEMQESKVRKNGDGEKIDMRGPSEDLFGIYRELKWMRQKLEEIDEIYKQLGKNTESDGK